MAKRLTGTCPAHQHPVVVEIDDNGNLNATGGSVLTPRYPEGDAPGASSEPILIGCPSCIAEIGRISGTF